MLYFNKLFLNIGIVKSQAFTWLVSALFLYLHLCIYPIYFGWHERSAVELDFPVPPSLPHSSRYLLLSFLSHTFDKAINNLKAGWAMPKLSLSNLWCFGIFPVCFIWFQTCELLINPNKILWPLISPELLENFFFKKINWA